MPKILMKRKKSWSNIFFSRSMFSKRIELKPELQKNRFHRFVQMKKVSEELEKERTEQLEI